ncbi:MAG: hypothetical protein GTO18_14820 [Anaerolineales bacterium]|nr:hypothetical protein [Anaerolineales bacterium]
MPKYWSKPIYELKTRSRKTIYIDVTTSVSPGLPPNKVLLEEVIPFFKRKKVHRILDFGAGALRHTIPLLEAGFEVCAVEFEKGFSRPKCQIALAEARDYHNFSALIWPDDFIKDTRKFDAALLIYVLQTMPIKKEREAVIKYIYKKMPWTIVRDSYVFYASRYGQLKGIANKYRVSDGYYMWPSRKFHSFYTEIPTEKTHKMFKIHGFKRIRSLSKRGTDQMFLYTKGNGFWP